MSYKSLLFCSDEKTARLVTQVLSELEFTVELAADTYATAKKLAEEHFDALVVDCQNEQDAGLLFKAARNSTENHSSLSVAVVDGQGGVAKAFRIGANLVLTKPINVEQSKSTLRVARGLLKKNQAKPADGTQAQPTTTFAPPTPAAASPSAFSAAAASAASTFSPVAAAATASAQSVPYESLEVEKDPIPSAEAADLAVLESLPHLPVTKAEPPVAPPKPIEKPFVVSSSAAAAAPAVEKKIVERHAAALSPMVTNEPIVKESTSAPAFENTFAVPTFSTLDSRVKEGGDGGKGTLKMVVAFALLGVAFYLGWQKLPGLLHRNNGVKTADVQSGEEAEKTESPAAQQNAAASTVAPAATTPAAQDTLSAAPAAGEPTTSSAAEQIAASAEAGAQASPEDIEVQEMPLSRDPKVTVTPKAQPLIVKNNAARRQAHQGIIPAAPSLDLAADNSTSPIADLVTSDAPLPKPAPGTIRISQGVSQGLLMKKVAPKYPPIALQLHKEGIVEMLATVDKEGLISNVKVLSGDPLLARAATDAVKQWEYRPYLLNGQPLAVETQISISFKLPK